MNDKKFEMTSKTTRNNSCASSIKKKDLNDMASVLDLKYCSHKDVKHNQG